MAAREKSLEGIRDAVLANLYFFAVIGVVSVGPQPSELPPVDGAVTCRMVFVDRAGQG